MSTRRQNILTLAALPGIVALFDFSPETGKPMSELAERLLRDEHPTLSRGERELIAAGVSMANETQFCLKSHSAFAKYNFEKEGHEAWDLSTVHDKGSKQEIIINLALHTAFNDAKAVKHFALEGLKSGVITEREVHDVVLIASAFCMYNRYVNCLDAPVPQEDEVYEAMAEKVYNEGYISSKVAEGASIH